MASTKEHYKCDITDTNSLENIIADVIKSIGDISVVLNNAANYERHEFLETTHEYFDWSIKPI